MYVRSIAATGLSGLAQFRAADLGRRVRVAGDARSRTALADALSLALCPFDPRDLREAGAALGWGEVEVILPDGGGLPEAVSIERPHSVLRLVAEPERRGQPLRVRVDLTLALDPPQLDTLRQAAIREPALGPALMGGAPLSLSVGWLFTRDGAVGTPSVLGARIGDVVVRPGETKDWLLALLRGLGRRALRRRPGELDVAAIDGASRSPQPGRQAELRRLMSELERAPFRLGRLSLVHPPSGPAELAFGDELVPLRALGPEAREAVGLAAAIHLHPSEILILESPLALASSRTAWTRWLTRQVEAAGSPLEQIWLFNTTGADALRPGRPQPRRPSAAVEWSR